MGTWEAKAFEGTPLSFTSLYAEPDGDFPNHEANPLKTETLSDLQAEVRKGGYDFGVAFDGDVKVARSDVKFRALTDAAIDESWGVSKMTEAERAERMPARAFLDMNSALEVVRMADKSRANRAEAVMKEVALLAARHKPGFPRDYLIILGCGLRADGTVAAVVQ